MAVGAIIFLLAMAIPITLIVLAVLADLLFAAYLGSRAVLDRSQNAWVVRMRPIFAAHHFFHHHSKG
jgi:hypothetical protein